MPSNAIREEVLNRLRTVKGHINGIEKMVEEGKSCEDILLQIAAVRSSIEKTGLIILENYAADCVMEDINSEETRQKLERVITTLIKFMK